MITLISAMGQNNEIGVDNKLLWDLPTDMKHFRTRTQKKTVVMGRKTFESIGMALPNRKNIILTRDKNYDISNFKNTFLAHSVQEILDMHEKEIQKNPEYEIMIIGGSTIYESFVESATNLSLTFVDANFLEADSFFPKINFTQFTEILCTNIKKDKKNIFDMKICEFKKIENIA